MTDGQRAFAAKVEAVAERTGLTAGDVMGRIFDAMDTIFIQDATKAGASEEEAMARLAESNVAALKLMQWDGGEGAN